MADKVRVGLLGLGRVSGGHIQGWLNCEAAELVVICDSDPSRLKAAQEQFDLSGVETSANMSEVLARDDLDAIDIALPDYLHRTAVLEAAAEGKAILCEKPLAQTADQAEDMLAAVEEAGVVHQLRLQRRHSPLVHWVRDLVAAGELGEIRHFRSRMSVHRIADPGVKLEWRLRDDLGTYGVLGDLGAHSLDLAYFVLGDAAGEIVQVAGLGAIFLPVRELEDGTGHGEVTGWDAVSFTLRYARNVLANFEMSRFSPGEDFWQIDGQEASIRVHGFGAGKLDWYERRPQQHQRPGSQWVEREVPEEYRHRPGEFEAFCQAVLESKPASPDFNDGLRICLALDRINAALEAAGLMS
ncbi:MAG: Gfo/Idh/MocA family oxidoreductase [Armatimonadetes bacterium]|nr:Gfo/Idh/MocA family oxidoreductase [Armatimonadota bacterium]